MGGHSPLDHLNPQPVTTRPRPFARVAFPRLCSYCPPAHHQRQRKRILPTGTFHAHPQMINTRFHRIERFAAKHTNHNVMNHRRRVRWISTNKMNGNTGNFTRSPGHLTHDGPNPAPFTSEVVKECFTAKSRRRNVPKIIKTPSCFHTCVVIMEYLNMRNPYPSPLVGDRMNDFILQEATPCI